MLNEEQLVKKYGAPYMNALKFLVGLPQRKTAALRDDGSEKQTHQGSVADISWQRLSRFCQENA